MLLLLVAEHTGGMCTTLALNEFLNSTLQVIAGLAKSVQLSFFTAGRHRVVNAPVNSLGGTRKDRAMLTRVIADGNHVVKLRFKKFIKRLGAMMRDVDAQLFHYRNRVWPDVTRHQTATKNLKSIAAEVTK